MQSQGYEYWVCSYEFLVQFIRTFFAVILVIRPTSRLCLDGDLHATASPIPNGRPIMSLISAAMFDAMILCSPDYLMWAWCRAVNSWSDRSRSVIAAPTASVFGWAGVCWTGVDMTETMINTAMINPTTAPILLVKIHRMNKKIANGMATIIAAAAMLCRTEGPSFDNKTSILWAKMPPI